MLLDNENENLKVHEWISKYTEEGQFDIVTGYFTVGALAYLSQPVTPFQKKESNYNNLTNIDSNRVEFDPVRNEVGFDGKEDVRGRNFWVQERLCTSRILKRSNSTTLKCSHKLSWEV